MKTIFKAIRMPVIFAFLFILSAFSTKEQYYKAEDTVDVISAGAWNPSTVLEEKLEFYKIYYKNQNSSLVTWVANDQISPSEVSTNQNIIEKEAAISKNTEEMIGDLPEIIGTSWSLLSIYEKGAQPKYLRIFPEYLFCKNGRWELHSDSNSMGQMGTYTIKGNQLITIHDGADKLTGKYSITWNATEKYLELNDGKLIFRLRYRTKTKC
ncbi:hypothetical protein SAMN05421813_107126 [Daejeonella rubra]|uniref:Lipocalin-like domain-containing protein n=1 Tax=Daejeonella rubra TaxID=990371 RepID=A0A1G9R6Y9_9SPHI|nr:hypothetical protein [Daejeonella rubra]SDM18993.1 hypothetical protein SAMN05421813_107126 [Daejeonella rubra]